MTTPSTDGGGPDARQYDAIGARYVGAVADSASNAGYERPATIALLGDVAGRHVLDVGCGPGLLSAWLVERGAIVTAFDASVVMADLAKKAVSDRARIVVADLSKPLPFAADRHFNLVVASLVLHYVEDWTPVFGEFRRVLAPGGAVVFSTHHPAMDWVHAPEDYFAVKPVTETWFEGAGAIEVTFWRRPLHAMTEAISSAGFLIERLVEPQPVPELADRDPVAYEQMRTKPRFLFFRLRATL